jgi:hypothetical protein
LESGLLGEFVFNPSRSINEIHKHKTLSSKNYSENENENESKVGIKRTMPTPAIVMVVSGDGKDGIFIRVVYRVCVCKFVSNEKVKKDVSEIPLP